MIEVTIWIVRVEVKTENEIAEVTNGKARHKLR